MYLVQVLTKFRPRLALQFHFLNYWYRTLWSANR